jgi:uncharacterized protein
MHFSQYTEVAGYARVLLWMSCAQKDHMDVGVQVRKIDVTGKPLEHLNYPCPVPVEQVPSINIAKTLGPQGFLRASYAILRDESKTSADGQEIFYKHDRREAVERGRVVLLDITLWPMGLVFAEGEGIMLRVSGHDMSLPEVEMARLQEPEDENERIHVICAGGEIDSCWVIPVILKV